MLRAKSEIKRRTFYKQIFIQPDSSDPLAVSKTAEAHSLSEFNPYKNFEKLIKQQFKNDNHRMHYSI